MVRTLIHVAARPIRNNYSVLRDEIAQGFSNSARARKIGKGVGKENARCKMESAKGKDRMWRRQESPP